MNRIICILILLPLGATGQNIVDSLRSRLIGRWILTDVLTSLPFDSEANVVSYPVDCHNTLDVEFTIDSILITRFEPYRVYKQKLKYSIIPSADRRNGFRINIYQESIKKKLHRRTFKDFKAFWDCAQLTDSSITLIVNPDLLHASLVDNSVSTLKFVRKAQTENKAALEGSWFYTSNRPLRMDERELVFSRDSIWFNSSKYKTCRYLAFHKKDNSETYSINEEEAPLTPYFTIRDWNIPYTSRYEICEVLHVIGFWYHGRKHRFKYDITDEKLILTRMEDVKISQPHNVGFVSFTHQKWWARYPSGDFDPVKNSIMVFHRDSCYTCSDDSDTYTYSKLFFWNDTLTVAINYVNGGMRSTTAYILKYSYMPQEHILILYFTTHDPIRFHVIYENQKLTMIKVP
ncbi:MAG: hypothetical protein GC181_12225 [Bacteroidetes bacterium]|nr:hypothetical protein [Bacteroidota bacterium]